MTAFAFAPNFAFALAARFCTGILNGNVAISKTYMAEITDQSNTARGFSMLSFTWGLGMITAPALGGFLADPAAQYPDSIFAKARMRVQYLSNRKGSRLTSRPASSLYALLQVDFFRAFPYVLPSLVSSGFALIVFFLGCALLPETTAFKSKARFSADHQMTKARDGVTNITAPHQPCEAVQAVDVSVDTDSLKPDDNLDEHAVLVAPQQADKIDVFPAALHESSVKSASPSLQAVLSNRVVMTAIAIYGLLATAQILFDELTPVLLQVLYLMLSANPLFISISRPFVNPMPILLLILMCCSLTPVMAALASRAEALV
jgi:MFS family permease